jgi:hypothetical protein
LGGWTARLEAQTQVWRDNGAQTAPATLTASELQPCPAGPGAMLGHPIATARPVPPASPGVPPASLGIPPASVVAAEVTPVSYQPPTGTAPLPPLPRDGAAPPPLPGWPGEAEETPEGSALIDQVSQFASDRAAVLERPAPAADAVPAVLRVGDTQWNPAPKATDNRVDMLPPAAFPAPAFLGTDMGLHHGDGVDGPVPDPLHHHFFVKAEYLLWAVRPYHIPALVTTADPPNPPNIGIIGATGTHELFGDSNIDGGLRSGLRLTAGCWCDMWMEEGIEASGFFLGQKNASFSTNSNQNAVIARPFFDLNNNREFVELVSFPGLQTGSITVNAPSRFFGVEGDYRTKICCGCDYRADLLVGFRYLNLDEDLNITENIQFGNSALLAPPFNPVDLRNQNGIATDDFHTKNQFYGGQVGISGEKQWGKWSVDGRFKLALGATEQDVTITGSQRFSPNSALNAAGGLLALPSNSGSFSKTRFTVVPEIDLNVGYQVTDHIRAFVGYNFLWWSSVLRPGDQIDRVLDITQIPNFATNGAAPTGAGRPAVPFKETSFWAQGLNVGIEFRY